MYTYNVYVYTSVGLPRCFATRISNIDRARQERPLKSNRHLNYVQVLATCTLTFSLVWLCAVGGVDLGEEDAEGWRCGRTGSAGGGW